MALGDAPASVVGVVVGKPTPRRKRKATEARRREEIEVLEQEVKALQAQVAELQKKSEAEAAAKASAKRSEVQQEMLETGFIRQVVLQQASLVNVQSALSRLTMTEPGAPHATSIRLGTDLKERWATLMQMKPIKL
ncbi:hypothetical protein PF005_g24634 [Phytophthora fragariae]|uniref:Uncharacterized protein n=1 Tax=Phytophthora fragariae TaxID=53985 RepID=A0A6A3IAF6_9STRA|nr:hypothetical protein PF003_g23507 [Phytophthora fragariae]KAE8923290.1 hypothetical protein PF009_g26454 [Phytophthora fragariae]KAE8977745.1 hypothetical protein PF011_g23529 [Phytophthora fragariae]KAE9074644.1 hypothetical protein PF007_g25324 [Phytophthora fragariae]KAE9085683.1 hypothetical protein PF006_g26196 [Phytophthora fragariae]